MKQFSFLLLDYSYLLNGYVIKFEVLLLKYSYEVLLLKYSYGFIFVTRVCIFIFVTRIFIWIHLYDYGYVIKFEFLLMNLSCVLLLNHDRMFRDYDFGKYLFIGMDDELDIEAESEFCISRHLHLCRLPFVLIEYKLHHQDEETFSMLARKIHG